MKTIYHTSFTSFLRLTLSVIAFLLLVGQVSAQKSTVRTKAGDIKVETLADNLNHPWGMAFLPDGRLLVTERQGTLRILDKNNKLSEPLTGTPEVFSQGQGGMLDVALDPNFKQNRLVYLSFAEPGENGTASTALGRGKLEGNELKDFKVIFSQKPKVEGPNHFGGRIVFSPDGHVFLTLGERFKFEPAQNLSNHLGTIVRINPDGSIPKDNPFVKQQNAEDEIWSYGHRNIEAAAIDPSSKKLWIVEMGPMGGDELNQPVAGRNYGWPVVSWGDNYDGSDIPNPPTRPEFADAVIHWTPTISPSGMIFYTGKTFPAWQGSGLIGGLTSSGIVRVQVKGEKAEEVERIPLNVRVRDVEQAPDGTIYVLTDQSNGKILHLKPLK
ncbi:PQQ-dependent sugar dehydrogenase [Pontibacter cellulosilyticus]|uniref:PQQ-dependent sugar dehydrogenase n=1 Tax=Pontibacter cellulosilyticus TaxID=1720253 RepID=A0A923N4W4_9BACT|nr:PQQ-dependent sugar dehydrogenase [Pontibacter cellulosilyticus]MBC5992268.1 PQQ-dependent sugar dehydrogenase [Pontibacter cellulosilyticus]